MGILLYLGVTPELLTSLTILATYQKKLLVELASLRHGVIVQRDWLASASPGEQYRHHIKCGGYRP